MFAQIGAVLAGAPAERERTPVRRQSRAAGKCEGVFWKRTNRQEVRQIVLAARRYEIACREPGTRNGPLGGVAIEVLDLFANLVNFRTGRLDPSIDFLMLKLRRSRDAIVRALKALRSHGFLDWLRRYVPTGNEGRGPQVQQTSNAYRLSLPARARKFLGRFGVTPPLPDDHVHAEAERVAATEAHRASLNIEERTLFDVGDNPLGQALARLARSIKQRESARQTESPSGFIKDRKE
ncbi:helix-turn-helix domain-containing protein (plasmid) [Agrobacterium sp. rho-8.1]|nr:helix-turn-helix domain-containing protein [Agrobacterium sp. rho-8.1]